MKTIKLISSVFIFGLLASACSKNDEVGFTEYDNYLKLDLYTSHNIDTDTICIVTLINTLDKEFEQECTLQYSLINKVTKSEFLASEDLINKRIANKPSLGYFNLQGGGNYNYVINLNKIKWGTFEYKSIENGEYDFKVNLFVKDPKSPQNIIYSNVIIIRK